MNYSADFETIVLAFALTLFAGLSTGIGSALAFFTKRTNTGFLSVSLGFSAGVMIYVSFVEIIPKALESLTEIHGDKLGNWYTAAAFFSGIFIIALIDRLIPSFQNPHEVHKVENIEEEVERARKQKLLKMGMFSALAIAIHNFPEGMATFISVLEDPVLGIAIAVAIAIHNIPEGIAISIPLYHATGSKKRAFLWSFLSGLAEPVGAMIGYIVLLRVMSDSVFGVIFAAVAGIMVFISLDELLPTAQEYGKPHSAIYGLIVGMMVMAVSLLLLM
jgi:zinc transporter, ZIP family